MMMTPLAQLPDIGDWMQVAVVIVVVIASLIGQAVKSISQKRAEAAERELKRKARAGQAESPTLAPVRPLPTARPLSSGPTGPRRGISPAESAPSYPMAEARPAPPPRPTSELPIPEPLREIIAEMIPDLLGPARPAEKPVPPPPPAPARPASPSQPERRQDDRPIQAPPHKRREKSRPALASESGEQVRRHAEQLAASAAGMGRLGPRSISPGDSSPTLSARAIRVRKLLSGRGLRDAVLLSEILGPPLSLRELP